MSLRLTFFKFSSGKRIMLMEQERISGSLRAPQGDGQTLISPPLDLHPSIIAANRKSLAQADYDVQGQPLTRLSTSARVGLLQRAIEYTSQYREIPHRISALAATNSKLASVPFVLSGHQPQLFHPGVWYKNFVLGSLARDLNAVPVHLLIDSDLCRSASIRVPTGTIDQPLVEVVPYDEPTAELPYEERAIQSFDTLQAFGHRAASVLRPLISDPLLGELWPLTLNQNPKETNLGLRLAQGRHALEERWGNDTLELPLSRVCELPEFAWFLSHILAHLPRFWAAYNDALARYRREHHMRNRAHPVPDLTECAGWLESPFWIWTEEDPRRRPLFAQQSGDELLITDRESLTFRLALTADRDAATAAEQLLALASQRIKIRTRALTTTLFARLVLSDFFLHGIGGAKYDQVADQIARTFFGFDPPAFATVSATLRLPIGSKSMEFAAGRSCSEQLREMRYHPEKYLHDFEGNANLDPAIGELLATKQRWVNTEKTVENAYERHVAIASANRDLQPYLTERRRAIAEHCHELQQKKRAAAILNSREYAFCLFSKAHFEKLLHG